jgi:very-short-patch-repair endonuclease
VLSEHLRAKRRGHAERRTKSCRFAKALRRKTTDAEIILWSKLRHKIADGHKFRRQHPIGPYIADFACVSRWLVVEVDGGTHSSDVEIEHDRKRDAFIASRGWRILRVANEDVYKRLDDVLESISRAGMWPSTDD